MAHRTTIIDIAGMKARGEKIPMLTAYDYTTARLADEAGMPMVLVGDSLGMVVLGYDSTIPVTMEDMIHHVKAVARGTNAALIVADLPFMTYQVDAAQALRRRRKAAPRRRGPRREAGGRRRDGPDRTPDRGEWHTRHGTYRPHAPIGEPLWRIQSPRQGEGRGRASGQGCGRP